MRFFVFFRLPLLADGTAAAAAIPEKRKKKKKHTPVELSPPWHPERGREERRQEEGVAVLQLPSVPVDSEQCCWASAVTDAVRCSHFPLSTRCLSLLAVDGVAAVASLPI